MWMGLTDLEAKVLRALLVEEEMTLTALAAELGSNRPAVSTAVAALVRRRLLERVTTRRPGVVFVHAHAEESLAQLNAEAAARERGRAEAIEATQRLVATAAARRRDRGRPHYELLPTARGSDYQPRSDRGRTSHDEVHPVEDTLQSGCSQRALVGCPTRLLVTGTGADLDAWVACQALGSEVRQTCEPLPALRIVDGERVGLRVTSRHGVATAWTRDGRHLRAAQELFDLWWERAGPGAIKPVPLPGPEPHWDVEEWDPEDL